MIKLREPNSHIELMTNLFKFSFLIVASLLFIESAHAQRLLINTYAGYAFEDGISYTDASPENTGTLQGGLIWGAGIEYIPYRSNFGAELLYLRQDTKAIPNQSNADTALDVGINYILFAPTSYFRLNRSETFFSYAGAMLGVGIVDTKSKTTSASTSNTSFAWGFNLGMKYLPSDNVALNLLTRLLSTSQETKDELYKGSQAAQVGNASILQFGIYGGISYIFNMN